MGGFGVGQIPYSSIIDYINFWELGHELGMLLIEVVKALDVVYMSSFNTPSKGKSDAANPRGSSKRQPPKRPRR